MGFNEKYLIETFNELVKVDSTTGKCDEIEKLTLKLLEDLGYDAIKTHKGGLIVDLGGEGNPLVVTAHLDDIGLMVRNINNDGTLKVCPIGGLYPIYSVGENVRVYTRDNEVYTGIITRNPNSIHVSEEELRTTPGDFAKDVRITLAVFRNNLFILKYSL